MSADPPVLPTSSSPDVPVVVASGGAPWEIPLIPVVEGPRSGLHLVRRCVDVADLLAVGRARRARVAIIAADLPRLDREQVARLRMDGVAVLVVETAQTAGRCLQVGASDVVGADAEPAEIVARVRDLAELAEPPLPGAQPAGHEKEAGTPRHAPVGRVVAVWGPTGAPGRSTVALNVANEAALAGVATLLVDADPAGGAASVRLGVLDEAPGLAAACRSAARGRLDASVLAAHALHVGNGLRVLTGATRPDRWRELRPAALEEVLASAADLASLVVVDLGSPLAAAHDDTSPGAVGPGMVAASVMACADVVVVVGSPDPLGMLRLVQALDCLDGPGMTARIVVVINRVREGVVGRNPGAQVTEALARFSGALDVFLLPDDQRATDHALRSAAPLAVVAPSCALRAAVIDLLHQVHPPEPHPEPAGGPSSGRRSSRRRRLSVRSRR